MSDLISRKAAIDAVRGEIEINGYSHIVDVLEQLPSAQPEPIKIQIDHELTHDELERLRKDMADAPIMLLPSAQPERKPGRWIYDNEAYPGGNPYGHYDCDQCGESVPHKTKFCPNCGAKMEVEHETD